MKHTAHETVSKRLAFNPLRKFVASADCIVEEPLKPLSKRGLIIHGENDTPAPGSLLPHPVVGHSCHLFVIRNIHGSGIGPGCRDIAPQPHTIMTDHTVL